LPARALDRRQKVAARVAARKQEIVVSGQSLKSLGMFVLVLAVMKFFFGWNISIIGSLVLTIILSVVMSFANKR
jgi:hypothetical protein